MHLLGSGEGPGGWLNNILYPVLLPPVLFHKGEKEATMLPSEEGREAFSLCPVWKRQETSIP